MVGQRLNKILDKLDLSRRDVALLITSLLLAFSIWFLYNMRLRYSAPLRVQVIAESNIPGHFRRSSTPTLVEARCRTTGFNLARLSRKASHKAVVVSLDPELLREEGEELFSISANELSAYVEDIFGQEVVLESFLAPSFSFRFPVENHKVVPVQPVELISYRSQYLPTSALKVQPDSVIVYGESSYIDNIDVVYTQKIALSNVNSSRKGSVKLEAPRNVRLSTKSVAYELDVVRYVEVRRIVDLSMRHQPAGKQLSILPSTAEVTLRCVFPSGAAHADEVQVYVDYEDFATSVDGRCVARVGALPQGVLSCTVSPDIFECVENVR